MATITWDNQINEDTQATARDTAPSNKDQIFGSIANQYQSALGRGADRIGQSEYLNWAKDLGNGQWGYTTPDWQNQIAGSAEAKAYAAQPKPTTQSGAGSGDWRSFGQMWLQSGGRTAQDLAAFVAAHPEYGASIFGNNKQKVLIGGRAFDAVLSAGAGGLGATWDDITNGEGGGGSNTASTYGNSASTELYVNEILSRLQQLRQPINDPMLTALQKLALERVQTNQGAPYTAGDDAAMVARYREPLTQARDAAYQRNLEEVSRRGMMASSGLRDVLDQGVNTAYQGAVAQGANDLGVQAVAEKNRRAQESLAILASLVSAGQQQRQEQNSQASDLLRTAALLPGLDESRLRLLLDASGDGTSATNSSLSALLNLAQLGQSASMTNANTAQNNADTFGAYLARILASMGGQ